MTMYDIGDNDLAKQYDQKKIAAKQRTPKLPKVECTYRATLLRVTREITDRAGKQYVFTFRVDQSSDERVLVGGVYKHVFYPGNGSTVDSEKFWNKVTPLLAVVTGQSKQAVDALKELGGLKAICDADPNIELGLPFAGKVSLESARPDKETGKIDPKYLEKDGVTPVKFVRDDFFPASSAA